MALLEDFNVVLDAYTRQSREHGVDLLASLACVIRLANHEATCDSYVELWRALMREQLVDWSVDYDTASAVARNVMQALIGATEDDAVVTEIADAAKQPVWVAGDCIWYFCGNAVYPGLVEGPGELLGTYAVWLPREYWFVKMRHDSKETVAHGIAERCREDSMRFVNQWRRSRDGDDTGHICHRCEEGRMLVRKWGKHFDAECDSCGTVVPLIALSQAEMRAEEQAE